MDNKKIIIKIAIALIVTIKVVCKSVVLGHKRNIILNTKGMFQFSHIPFTALLTIVICIIFA